MTKPKAKKHGKNIVDNRPALPVSKTGGPSAASAVPRRGSADKRQPPRVAVGADKAAAKPQMAPRKAPVASPRPESIGMESTSPINKSQQKRDPLTPGPHPTALPPATGPLSAFAQAQVMWYHHPDNYWVMGLVWSEHENRDDVGAAFDATRKGPPVVRVLKAYHMLHRGQSGGIDYLKIPPKDEPHFDPTRATTTRAAFETYLADTLRKHGGARDAYRILGIAPPIATPIAVALDGAPKPVKVEHEEMYERAARLLAVPVADLKTKYGHLNNGMQMMNLRNRLRAKGHNV